MFLMINLEKHTVLIWTELEISAIFIVHVLVLFKGFTSWVHSLSLSKNFIVFASTLRFAINLYWFLVVAWCQNKFHYLPTWISNFHNIILWNQYYWFNQYIEINIIFPPLSSAILLISQKPTCIQVCSWFPYFIFSFIFLFVMLW